MQLFHDGASHGLFSAESIGLAFVLSILLLAIFGDHLWHVFREWRAYRDARSFNHFLIGFVAEMGMLSIFVSRGSRLGLWGEFWAAMTGLVLTGSLLTVGLYLVISWHSHHWRSPR